MRKTHLFGSQAWLDERAFEDIFNDHYTRIFGVLFRLTGDHDEADDLTAETFWRLWERPPGSPDNVAGWLYRVATRTGYNALRAGKRRALYEAKDSLPTAQVNPEDDVERRMERRQVREILRQMTLRDVQALILRHSGLSYQEIGVALKLNSASVGTLLSRAEDRFEALYRQGDGHASKR